MANYSRETAIIVGEAPFYPIRTTSHLLFQDLSTLALLVLALDPQSINNVFAKCLERIELYTKQFVGSQV